MLAAPPSTEWSVDAAQAAQTDTQANMTAAGMTITVGNLTWWNFYAKLTVFGVVGVAVEGAIALTFVLSDVGSYIFGVSAVVGAFFTVYLGWKWMQLGRTHNVRFETDDTYELTQYESRGYRGGSRCGLPNGDDETVVARGAPAQLLGPVGSAVASVPLTLPGEWIAYYQARYDAHRGKAPVVGEVVATSTSHPFGVMVLASDANPSTFFV